MADIAGLVLGGIPLAIWALEKYAEPFEEFQHYRITIETFRADLTLQNWQLQRTLDNVGLSNKPSAAEMRECFDAQFPSISGGLMVIVQRMSEVTADLLENLEVDSHIKPDALPEKVQWEWRRVKRSFGSKKRNKVINDLRHWNADLSHCLESAEVPEEDGSRYVRELTIRFNKERCSSLRQCLGSLHRALQSRCRCECSPPHQAAIDLDWKAYETGAAQTFKVAVSYKASLQSSVEEQNGWRKMNVTMGSRKMVVSSSTPSPLLQVPIPTRSRSSSSLRAKISKRFSRSRSTSFTPPISPMEDSRKAIATNTPPEQPEIFSLCAAVSSSCIPWSVFGLVKDPETHQGVRQFSLEDRSTEASRIIRRVPLRTLISLRSRNETQPRNPYLTLTAKQRYGIAAATAWSVLYLSGSPWLGDRWDTEQASIFLEEHAAGREIPSQCPSLACVLGIPDGPARKTESQTLQETQSGQPEHDLSHLIPNKHVFALGIFLIELCLDLPFEEMREAAAGEASLLEDYQTALRNLEEVRRVAGDSYGYAVERCVKFSFQGRDVTKSFDFASFRQDFYSAVVAPIQATYRQFPDSRNAI